jgi:hypothetical protein
MRAIFSNMRRAAPIRQNRDRPFSHVPSTITSEGTTPIMHGTPDIRIPAQRLPAPAHQSWCADHALDDEGFGSCVSADMILPGVQIGLTWRPGEDVQASICTGVVVETITLDELEHRSRAMLSTALIGRGATLPASAGSELAAAVTP